MQRLPESPRGSLRALAAVLSTALASGALAAGCAGERASASSEPATFDQDRAWAHLETQVSFGPRPSGSEALERTRAWLERELAAIGLEPVREPFVAQTPLGPIEMANVYADIPGRKRDGKEPPIVILCSHYDTKRMDTHPDPGMRDKPFVGANDAASSTAVLLELARVLSSGTPRPMTYRVLFVDGEEATLWEWRNPDNRYGSRHHAARLARSALRPRVAAAVILDMVGDRDLQLNRDLNSDRELLEIFFSAARKNGLGRYVDGRAIAIEDDHLSFLEIDVRACNLIDLDYHGRDERGRVHDWWHTPEDTPDKCAPESLGIAGRIVLLGLPELEERLLGRR